MYWLKKVGFLLICVVLTCLLTKFVLVKEEVSQIQDFSSRIETFRHFQLDPDMIQEIMAHENDWQRCLALNYLYDGERLNRDGFISKGSWFQMMLPNTLLEDYRKGMELVLADATIFPVPIDETSGYTISYEQSWQMPRSYGGNRTHEGCDLMPSVKEAGYFPVQSVSAGTVEKIGWLTLGGNRVGVRRPSGTFFYYAHLDSYAHGLKVGDTVVPGQTLGQMGDSGYGPEGTVGQFPTHLHFGIYIPWKGTDISVNPYCVLKSIEKNRNSFRQNGA